MSSFCSAKATHIFSAKNIRLLYIESVKTVNEMTLNEVVKITTLWTTGPWFLIFDLLCVFVSKGNISDFLLLSRVVYSFSSNLHDFDNCIHFGIFENLWVLAMRPNWPKLASLVQTLAVFNLWLWSLHYENTPIQIHCKFYRRKYENIKMKNCDIFLGLLKI